MFSAFYILIYQAVHCYTKVIPPENSGCAFYRHYVFCFIKTQCSLLYMYTMFSALYVHNALCFM